MIQIALTMHGGMMHYRQGCIPEFEERKHMYGHSPGMSEPMLRRGKVYDSRGGLAFSVEECRSIQNQIKIGKIEGPF